VATKNYAYIAEEGHSMLALVATCAIALQLALGGYAAIPAWLLLGALLVTFRDPTQSPPSLPLAVVSPLHGRVLAVGPSRDPWLKREAESFVIETGMFDIRSIYAPVEGKILEQWSKVPDIEPGDENPAHSSAYWIRTDEDDDIVLVITRSSWGGQVRFNYNPGERIGQGRRIGFANFGCRARLYLPPGSRYEVALGEHVSAGSGIVGSLVHLTRMAKSPMQTAREGV
jgi:phosphatidylserine decarboxylase